jgi:hypothetical protein
VTSTSVAVVMRALERQGVGDRREARPQARPVVLVRFARTHGGQAGAERIVERPIGVTDLVSLPKRRPAFLARADDGPLQNAKLLTQGQVLCRDRRAARDHGTDKQHDTGHDAHRRSSMRLARPCLPALADKLPVAPARAFLKRI